jgi:hypothetical protein
MIKSTRRVNTRVPGLLLTARRTATADSYRRANRSRYSFLNFATFGAITT